MKKIFLFFILVVFVLPNAVFSWLPNYAYRIPITIKENSGTNLQDYQIKFTVNTQVLISNGYMRPDCGDIRVTDSNDNLLPYWIESGCNTPNTIIWTKIPNIPANSNITIYMYFGNPNATSLSNGDLVFEFFDDFNGTTLNTTKWTGISGRAGGTNGSYYISNGIIILNGYSIWSNINITVPFVLETRFSTDAWSYGGYSGIKIGQPSTDPNWPWTYASATVQASQWDATGYHAICGNAVSPEIIPNLGTYYNVILIATSNTVNLTFIGLKSQSVTCSSYILGYSGRIGIGAEWWYANTRISVDWVGVRKYAPVEPTVTVGPATVSRGILSINTTSSIPYIYQQTYAYAMPIKLYSSYPLTIPNVVIPLTLDTQSLISQGLMNPDCSDISITYVNSTGEYRIPFYVDPYTCNTKNTLIFVKLPTYSVKPDTYLYLYFGSKGAIPLSTPQAFYYFVDFSNPPDYNKILIFTNGSSYNITPTGIQISIPSSNNPLVIYNK